MANFTKTQRAVVAAMFARSNMGQRPADVSHLHRLFQATRIDVENATISLCEEFMETNADERAFVSEAKMWFRDKKLKSLDTVRAVWPDMAEQIEAAL